MATLAGMGEDDHPGHRYRQTEAEKARQALDLKRRFTRYTDATAPVRPNPTRRRFIAPALAIACFAAAAVIWRRRKG